MVVSKKSKNQLRREKQKLKKHGGRADETSKTTTVDGSESKTNNHIEFKSVPTENKKIDAGVSNKVSDKDSATGKIFESEFDALLEKPEFAQFKHVFDKFHMEESHVQEQPKGDIMDSEDDEKPEYGDDESENEKLGQPQLSKKKQRKANKIPLTELKASAKYPELVQWYDVDAADPLLVVEIKSQKNYVPVPAHWQFKREYLSGRRSIEKKPFTLPKFISETGITDMRDTTKDDDSNMKQRMREKVQPKMNRLDLDYQKLHDAFFKFQSKPRLFGFGDVYFEGRENEELDITKYKPGVVSDELRNALGIPKGITLPWVQKMQHFGPPPSYPDLKIPGYNVDITEEEGVFGEDEAATEINNVEVEPFGKLLSYESSEEEEEDDDEEDDDEEDDNGEEEGQIDEDEVAIYLSESEVRQAAGTEESKEELPSYEPGANSEDEDVPLAEVEAIRKESQTPKKLYHVIQESEQSDGGFMASKRAYDLSNVQPSNDEANDSKKKQKVDQVQENGNHNEGNQEKEQREEEEDDDDDDDEEEGEEGTKFRF